MPFIIKKYNFLVAIILFSIATVAGLKILAKPLTQCDWRSIASPNVAIKINRASSIGILSGDLIYKGKRIRQLLFGQPNGYGSRWWAFAGVDGNPIGGGRLLPFKGTQPIRGVDSGSLNKESPRRVLLVNLGAALYYSDFRREKDLHKAGEGFWQLDKGCYFPGRE